MQCDADVIYIDSGTDDEIPTDNHQGFGISLADLNLLGRKKCSTTT